MNNNDYGFYGKGTDGYVHYRQGMQEASQNRPTVKKSFSTTSAKPNVTADDSDLDYSPVIIIAVVVILIIALLLSY